MRDLDIRKLLRDTLIAEIQQNDPSSFVIDEMEVCRGDARVDLAVINGKISGFEIKSSLDDLRRLPNQVEMYSRVLDSVTIITTEDHQDGLQNRIPEWWGIIVVNPEDQSLQVIRDAADNPSTDPFAVASLLWREEALSILSIYGLDHGIKSKPREILWKRLATSLPLSELKRTVRNKLKERATWRSDQPQMSDDDLFPLFAT